MSRLDGGPSCDSSTSRSWRRSRSSLGDRVAPAPAGVPVDRRVRIGLVGPVVVRPAAGVWLKVRSWPLPPRLTPRVVFAFGCAADFFDPAFLFDAFRTGFRAVLDEDFRAAFRLVAFRAGDFREPVFLARDGAFLAFRALARPFLDAFRAPARPLAVDFAFAAPRFFAGVLLLAFVRVVFAMCASERSRVEFDRWPLSVVSSSAYLTCR
jgi:hypothetical protein